MTTGATRISMRRSAAPAKAGTPAREMTMPRPAKEPGTSQRAVFSVPVPTRDRDLAEVRAKLEHGAGRSVNWYEVIDYLYRYWKETKGDEQ
jgi:hypothetical protein